jgi:Gpi18-like mannosyltransferase
LEIDPPAGGWKLKIWPLIFLMAFPTSFFFGAVYTEGLFFLLLVSTLYFLKKKGYFLAAIFAFLASLTRFVGVFLIIPILFHWFSLSFPRRRESRLSWIPLSGMTLKMILSLLAPIIGLLTYCFYLFKTTGDPFFFFSSQPAFGASRSTHLISFLQVYWRYFKIFITARWNFQYFVSIIEFSFFSFVFAILILDLFKNLKIKNWKFEIENYDLLGLNLFSLVNIVLPTLTGTFLSIPRFSLMSLSFFIYLSQIKNVFIKYLILGIFLILHILLLGYFTQGYFIS